jgi:hypothetical protein
VAIENLAEQATAGLDFEPTDSARIYSELVYEDLRDAIQDTQHVDSACVRLYDLSLDGHPSTLEEQVFSDLVYKELMDEDACLRLYDRLYDPEASVVLNPLSMLKVALEFEQFAAHSRYLRGKVDIQRVAVARLLTRVRFYSCSGLKLQISNSL